MVKLPTAVLGVKTYISYTNGVFETRHGVRIVYMPWYDEPTLDNAARRAYESAGWQVVPIPVRTVFRFGDDRMLDQRDGERVRRSDREHGKGKADSSPESSSGSLGMTKYVTLGVASLTVYRDFSPDTCAWFRE